jgi:hypothetical protein
MKKDFFPPDRTNFTHKPMVNIPRLRIQAQNAEWADEAISLDLLDREISTGYIDTLYISSNHV